MKTPRGRCQHPEKEILKRSTMDQRTSVVLAEILAPWDFRKPHQDYQRE